MLSKLNKTVLTAAVICMATPLSTIAAPQSKEPSQKVFKKGTSCIYVREYKGFLCGGYFLTPDGKWGKPMQVKEIYEAGWRVVAATPENAGGFPQTLYIEEQ